MAQEYKKIRECATKEMEKIMPEMNNGYIHIYISTAHIIFVMPCHALDLSCPCIEFKFA